MNLIATGAEFLKYAPYPDTWTERHDGVVTQVSGIRRAFKIVGTLAEADGVQFLCPKCFRLNGGKVGTHSVICWFVGKVPDDLEPKPGRWIPYGTGLADLTFAGPGAASVLLTGGCGWHGFVTNGEAE